MLPSGAVSVSSPTSAARASPGDGVAQAVQGKDLAFHGVAGQGVLGLVLGVGLGQAVGKIAVEQRAAPRGKGHRQHQHHGAAQFLGKLHGDSSSFFKR